MIRAVVFDWGGVLIKNPAAQMSQYCADALQVPVKRFQQIYKGFLSDFQKGLISEDTLWEALCAQLNCKKPAVSSLWEDAFRNAYVENSRVFQLASQLHMKGYCVGLLSNTEVPAMRFFLQKHYPQFDVSVFSCTEATRKPEERIYQILLSRLALNPEKVVFIDDTKDYVIAAEKIRINAILFKDPHQLIQELSLTMQI